MEEATHQRAVAPVATSCGPSGRKFLGWHVIDGEQAGQGIMDGVNALLKYPSEPDIELTGLQKRFIQGRKNPE